MKFAFLFLLSAVIFPLHAETFQSRVHSIDIAPKKGLPHLIMLENGSVVFVKYQDTRLINEFRQSMREEDLLNVKVDEKNNFVAAESVENETEEEPAPSDRPNMSYVPTVLKSGTEAQAIFQKMNRKHQRSSQCYNRAHVWAYEEFKRSGLQSMKHFLFFTRRYIRNYRYKWWFHVTPSVVVEGLGERTLDRTFTSGHRSLSSWTSNFIYSGRKCPVVNKYSDYRNNQEKQDCYLIPVSMYFWQPRDIERRDRTGFEKTSFIKSEVDHAYWEAF